MARLPRFVIPGQPQHIIQRGNNRDVIFARDDDYHFYLEKFQDACEMHNCDIHAYVLMTNHVHLLMTPHTEDKNKGSGSLYNIQNIPNLKRKRKRGQVFTISI